MPQNIIDNLSKVVNKLEVANNKPINSSKIYIYGGEPLLNNSQSYNYVKSIIEQFSLNDIFITTNGFELDKYFDLLTKIKRPHVQITLDGPKLIHDNRRVTKNKQSSFDRICQHIKAYRNISKNYVFRINVDRENYTFILDLFGELHKQGIVLSNELPSKVYIAPVTNRSKLEIDIEFYKMFIDYYVENLYELNIPVANIRPLDFAISLFNGDQITPSFYYCDAMYGKYVIDPEGNIGVCEEAMVDKAHIIGQVKKDGDVSYSKSEWSDREVDNLIDCQNCTYRYLCCG